MEESNTKRMNIRMPVSIHEWVVKEAAEHGVSATAFISMKLSEVRRQEEMSKFFSNMSPKEILELIEKNK